MKVLWILPLLIQVHAEYGINKKCITPHGQNATCVEISSCIHLYNEISIHPKNIANKKYVQQSFCGMRNKVHLVCCHPKPEEIFEECGVIETGVPRIFGGKIVEDHFPWIAALQYKDEGKAPDFRCAGFLINSQFILTAAHCLKGKPIHSVHLGLSNLTNYQYQTGHQKVDVINITFHEDYRTNHFMDDIGLIRIEPIKYTENIRWICLPKKQASLPDWYTVRGWGRNDISSADSEINCILLKHCPLALKLVETKRNDPATIKFLRFTHCGFKGKAPMVWCNMFNDCETPDGEKGKCVSVRKCAPLINLITKLDISNQTNEKYLKEFRCSTIYDPDIKVCCKAHEKEVDVDDTKIDVTENPRVDDRFAVSLPNPHLQECGRQNSDNRIYGGVEADLDEFPWMALLKYQKMNGGFVNGCGGSLIHSRFVLTAAHCLDTIVLRSKGLNKIHRIILGEYDTRNKTDCIYSKYGSYCADPVQEIEMESSKIHPGYMSGYADHDIGIIKLMEKVRFTDYIKPICLPSATLELTEKDIYMISGWGKTSKEETSPVKRKARIEIVENDNCNVYRKEPLDVSKICAGGTGDGIDACYGDSGGPLMLGRNLNSNYINFVIGIISHGFGRTCGTRPGVYTYVPYYVEWIQSSLVF